MAHGQDQAERRRRIDRVTAPDYLEGLAESPTEDVRAMRDDCRHEEGQLSYLRRMLQGQLDIALVEQSRRAQEGEQASLVADLPAILSDRPGGARQPRSVPLYEPDDTGRRRSDAERFSSLIGRLPELDDADVTGLVEALREEERQVSGQRRLVLDRLDRLQDELVRRYRKGAASVDDLVAPTLSAGPDEPAR